MFGHPETRQSFGLAQKAGTLLLAILLPMATSAQGAGGVSGGMSSGSMTLGGGLQSAGASQAATPAGITAMQGLTAPSLNSPMQPDNIATKNVADRTNNLGQEASVPPAEDLAVNEFQSFIAQSVGRVLPMYGYNLFKGAASTFAPVDNVPVTPDYMIGPGDELVINVWGQVDANNLRLVVNRNGQIEIPKVGSVNVAGIRYQDLPGYLKGVVGDVFRNFDLNVTLGKLRSIQVFVLGQAKRPGVYTVSSLSTLVNTLFASGGPSVNGSMRHIQIKRNGKLVTEMDLYELLLKGDKTHDISLLPGDVIYIPPVGHLAAISGSVNNSAIFELKDDKATLSELIELSGGLTTVAAEKKVMVERIDDHKVRKVEEFMLDNEGQTHLVRDGDLVKVLSIDARFDNAVTLRGNVAGPGRYPWKEGMRVKDLVPDMNSLIVPAYWHNQNQASKANLAGAENIRAEVKHSVAEINWDYAIIERLNKVDLTTQLIPFNLGRAIEGRDPEQNPLLQPGDTITVFSKDDIRVPVAKRSIYVKLEGEVNNAGVYKALPGETLRQLVVRVGGLTPNAYLFGSEFDRESVRQMQQKKLKQMADRMEEAVQRNLANKSQSALTPEDAVNSKTQAAAQIAQVERMKKTRASGRIVLDIPAESERVKDIPDLSLEDGDSFIVPSKPSVVSVMGMVYNENAFIYRSGKNMEDYLGQAGGPTRDADESRIYLLRADGSVQSAQSSSSIFGRGLSGEVLMPGDAVIVPELMDKLAFSKELQTWSQIFFQFALGVGGIKMLRL